MSDKHGIDIKDGRNMDYPHLSCEVRDGVARIELDRPPVNALTQAFYREIAFVFQNLDVLAPGARVVVLSGSGRHFCAGNDLGEFTELDPGNAVKRMREVREAFFAVSRCPIPVIGALHGAALGSGLVLAASCDFVIAAEGALFGVPELTAGVLGGARHLARLVPEPVLRWMYLTSDPVSVEQLAGYGALIKVVPGEELIREATAIAAQVSRHSARSLRYAKESLNTIEWMPLEEGYVQEQKYTIDFCAHPDSREAINSIVEKRAPVYAHTIK